MNPPKRGEACLADLGQSKQEDHQQAGRRPTVIFQTDDLAPLNTVVIIPLTTQLRRAGFANTVLIPAGEAGQDRDSVALCHQIRPVDRRKLMHKIGELAPETLSEIETALLFVLGILS
jgi:mRNA interferase MazF